MKKIDFKLGIKTIINQGGFVKAEFNLKYKVS